MKKIRIAQIGCGHDHSDLFKSLVRRSDLYEIAGCCLFEEEKAAHPKRLAYFEGYPERTVEQLLNDPAVDAVAIETRERDLTKYALLAAEAGKAVHVDKPGGFSLPEFEKLIETVKQNRVPLHLGYMYRDNPFVAELRRQVKNGELGQIVSIDAEMNCRHKAEKRQWLDTLPGGMMFFLGCHLVDLVLQLQGEPQRIIPLNRATGTEGVSAEDFGMAVFEYPHGVSTVKTSAAEYGGYARRHLVVTGAEKTVELRPIEVDTGNGNERYTVRTEYTQQPWRDTGVTTRSANFFRYDPMLEAFARQIRGEEENPFTPGYELLVYKTLLTCCGMGGMKDAI